MKRLLNIMTLVTAVPVVMLTYSCNSTTSSTTSTSDSTSVSRTDSLPKAAIKDTVVVVHNNTSEDEDFILEVIENNITENRMLQAALEKGTNDALKQDAQQMLADNRAIAKQIQDYAKHKNYVLSIEDTVGNLQDIAGKTDKQWQRGWATLMVNDHRDMILDFQDAQKSVSDSELKVFIVNTLPVLHNHLEMAQNLVKK